MNEQSLSVEEAIRGRRSIKMFNGQPVDREDLMEIIDIAVWAPNHGNRQPWRIVLASGSELDELKDLIREYAVPDWKELSEEVLAKKMQKFVTPGAYAFVIVPQDVRQKERYEDFAAASGFIQNIQLLAWDRGIGACWKTPNWIDNPKFRDALGVKPEERIISMLQFGYFDTIPKEKPRKSAEEIVTNFGEKE
ncbi:MULTISPECIES: nitroreductase [unclassified Rummeliibacillus]|uniref:nitroreductase family protein n=1 Tax=unclassified Rummeliibacillus TaxID=2622809 RepID=UPI000E66DBAD|nr:MULTISPECIES: nitroreductase [unclassified Rummeliibacillus]RIJ69618.1 nitroreductase [Rummeliibacillus sp. POC4]RPJ96016.1 nitroreductase [Rummeliibacillus sp. TYF005]